MSNIPFINIRRDVHRTNCCEILNYFQSFKFELTAGVHTLKWVYFKDFLFSLGEDRAFLTTIEFDGISYAADKCMQFPRTKTLDLNTLWQNSLFPLPRHCVSQGHFQPERRTCSMHPLHNSRIYTRWSSNYVHQMSRWTICSSIRLDVPA